MTDKEIIIDGVNVAGCEHLEEWEHCAICQELIKTIDRGDGKMRTQCVTVGDLCCKFYPDCHYKQLQRKEQELLEFKNRELKLSLQKIELEKEYEKLETKLKKVSTTRDNNFIHAYELRHKNQIYKQALEKIEEITINLRTRTDYHSEEEVNADIDKILNIINEVKDANI